MRTVTLSGQDFIVNPLKGKDIKALKAQGFDLMGGGPVGALAFVLVLVTFLASRLFMALNNDTLFMPVAIMLALLLLVEMILGRL